MPPPRPGRSFFWKSIHVSCAADGPTLESMPQIARVAVSSKAGARIVSVEGNLAITEYT